MIALAALLLAAAGPNAPHRCLGTGEAATLTGIDPTHLRAGDWISTLPAACPGLDGAATIVTDRTGGTLCAGEPVRVSRPGETIGRPCTLGPFVRQRIRRQRSRPARIGAG